MEPAQQVDNQSCHIEDEGDQEQVGTAVAQGRQGQAHDGQQEAIGMSHYLQEVLVRDLLLLNKKLP